MFEKKNVGLNNLGTVATNIHIVNAIANSTDLQRIRIGSQVYIPPVRSSKNNSLVDWHHSSRDGYPAGGE